jgi:hypothetical protein
MLNLSWVNIIYARARDHLVYLRSNIEENNSPRARSHESKKIIEL